MPFSPCNPSLAKHAITRKGDIFVGAASPYDAVSALAQRTAPRQANTTQPAREHLLTDLCHPFLPYPSLPFPPLPIPPFPPVALCSGCVCCDVQDRSDYLMHKSFDESKRLGPSPFTPTAASQAKTTISVNYYLNSPDQKQLEADKRIIAQKSLRNSAQFKQWYDSTRRTM